MENTIYKSTLSYKTKDSKFVVQFIGTLPSNILRIDKTLAEQKEYVLSSAVHSQLTNNK
jgi:hypothetical protein